MKEEIVRLGLVQRCTDYIKLNAPPNKERHSLHLIKEILVLGESFSEYIIFSLSDTDLANLYIL